MATGTFDFTTGLRGFHVYGDIWKPSLNQVITFKRGKNRYDRFAVAGMTKLPGTLAPSVVGHMPRQLSRFIWYAIEKGARITATVISTKAKLSPLVQGGLEIPVFVKVEWENEINLERLKTKVASLAYSLEEDYVDESKDILGEILKDNDNVCDVPTSDDDEVVECETEKNTELVVINDD